MLENVTDIKSSSLYSEDLAPVPLHKRTWNTWNYAALWISMSLCIPTYMLASSLIGGGMNWWQAIFTIFLGNTIVLIPMILNGITFLSKFCWQSFSRHVSIWIHLFLPNFQNNELQPTFEIWKCTQILSIPSIMMKSHQTSRSELTVSYSPQNRLVIYDPSNY